MKLRLTLFLLLCVGVGLYNTYNHLTGWEYQFKQSPTLIFYSLRPGMPPVEPPSPLEQVHNIPGLVLGKVAISDQAGKEQIIEATKQALSPQRNNTYATCFNPRLAIASADGKTIVILCFECGHTQIITARGVSGPPINRSAGPLFDALIKKYNLKFEN